MARRSVEVTTENLEAMVADARSLADEGIPPNGISRLEMLVARYGNGHHRATADLDTAEGGVLDVEVVIDGVLRYTAHVKVRPDLWEALLPECCGEG